jgi:hypothetical protein
LLAGGGVAFARAMGCPWPTIAVFLVLLTLRHRIAKTGANSLEGYFHPRMLGFACGVFALAAVARARQARAVVWIVVTALVHTTTALWFGGVVAVATLWPWRRSPRRWLVLAGAGLVAVSTAALALPGRLVRMDEPWLAVLADKDYLFSADWPLYAWLTNLAYPVVIVAIHRQRVRRGLSAAGEPALVAGLLALVALFAVSVPLTEARLALAVQLQVNRVFWVLDLVALLYVAWWLTHGTPALARARTRQLVAGTLLVLAVARGMFVVAIEARRPLAAFDLPSTAWTDVMGWLRTQPRSWHVLADPDHGWKYGSSVRVAARRDTLIEVGKDTALAMYDREAAGRVGDRMAATAGFDDLTDEDIRALDRRFALDVLVDRTERRSDFPVLYRNTQFVVYDLR